MKRFQLRQIIAAVFVVLFFVIGVIGAAEYAIIRVPVADMFVQNPAQTDPKSVVMPPPISGVGDACIRSMQGLFNEMVTVEEREGDYARVKLTHCFYCRDDQHPKDSLFWMLADALLSLGQIKSKKLSLRRFVPSPIRCDTPSTVVSSDVVVLQAPWLDEVTHQVYSLGTRFVRVPSRDRKDAYAIRLLDCTRVRERTSFVPKSVGLVTGALPVKERVRNYINLVKKYAAMRGKFVPYVWGGCSVTALCSDPMVTLCGDGNSQYYRRSDQSYPCSGVDCSSLIMRCAQASGLPYFFRNTKTAEKNVRHLTGNDAIAAGDMLLFPGHIWIVTDVKNNLVAQAEGYNCGVGKVHEKPLSMCLRGIHSYKQLMQYYREKKPIIRIDPRDPEHKDVHALQAILQLSSIF